MADICGLCNKPMLEGDAPVGSFFTFATENGSRVVHTTCVVNVMTKALEVKHEQERQGRGAPPLGQRPFFCPWCFWSTKIEAYRVAHVMQHHSGVAVMLMLMLYDTDAEAVLELNKVLTDRGRLSV